MTIGLLHFRQVLDGLVEYNFKMQLQDKAKGQEKIPSAKVGESPAKPVGPLWADGSPLQAGKRLVARALMIELLRVSRAGRNFVSCAMQATAHARAQARKELREQLGLNAKRKQRV